MSIQDVRERLYNALDAPQAESAELIEQALDGLPRGHEEALRRNEVGVYLNLNRPLYEAIEAAAEPSDADTTYEWIERVLHDRVTANDERDHNEVSDA